VEKGVKMIKDADQIESSFLLATIGAGIHAETNIYPSLANHLLESVEKVAVCDLDETKAKRMAAISGFRKTYVDFREMIEKEKPDGVIVCLNAKLHPQVVIECLRMGTHVLVEKPPARTVEEAKEMLAVSQSTGKIVMIAHQKRHATAYKKAQEIVSDQENFGRIVQIEAKMHGMGWFPTNFTCLLEWQIHNIDLLRAFGGDIEEISVVAESYGDNLASLVFLLRFKEKAIATVSWGTFGGPGPYCERLEIIGEKGKGVIVENAYDLVFYDGSWGRRWRPDWNPNLANQSHILNGYVGEILHFIECARKNETPSPSIEDGVKSLEAIYEIAGQAGITPEWQFAPSRY
jgi:predicted dehydrogenase